MRLLFFLYSLGAGGAERVTTNLANYWARQGWQVRVVTLTTQTSDFYKLDAGVERVQLGLAAESATSNAALWRNLSRIRALRRELAKFSPDVAVGMMNTACVVLALASAGFRRLKVIGSERVHPGSLGLSAGWELARRITYGLLDAVVVQAPETAQWLAQRTWARRFEVIANPVVYPIPEQFDEAGCPGTVMDKHRQWMIAVGRLDPQKGFDLLIKAFASRASMFPDWDVVILGDGPQRTELHRLIATFGLEGRVHLTGRVGNVGAWLERSDAYVLSSRFEGFPNTLLEAMAYGLPVVSFDCDTGPRSMIKHEINGLLIEPGGVENLACGLERIMMDSGLRARLAANAIGLREEYSIESIARRWEALFSGLLRL